MLREYSVIKLDAPWFYYRPPTQYLVHIELSTEILIRHRIALFAAVSPPWSGLVGGGICWFKNKAGDYFLELSGL